MEVKQKMPTITAKRPPANHTSTVIGPQLLRLAYSLAALKACSQQSVIPNASSSQKEGWREAQTGEKTSL